MNHRRGEPPTATDRALDAYGRALAALVEAAELTDGGNRHRPAQDRLGAIEHRYMLTPSDLVERARVAGAEWADQLHDDRDHGAAATVERLVRELDDVPLADLPERLSSAQAMRAYLAHNDRRRGHGV